MLSLWFSESVAVTVWQLSQLRKAIDIVARAVQPQLRRSPPIPPIALAGALGAPQGFWQAKKEGAPPPTHAPTIVFFLARLEAWGSFPVPIWSPRLSTSGLRIRHMTRITNDFNSLRNHVACLLRPAAAYCKANAGQPSEEFRCLKPNPPMNIRPRRANALHTEHCMYALLSRDNARRRQTIR